MICSLFRPGFVLLPVTGEGGGNLILFKCNVMAEWSVLIVAIISIFSTSSRSPLLKFITVCKRGANLIFWALPRIVDFARFLHGQTCSSKINSKNLDISFTQEER